jgi:hypothetical protein
MKRIHVKNYQVLINEETANCGVAINIDHYSKIKIEDFNLKYEVKYNDKKIKVWNSELEIILYNCDKNFLYYALKTINLGFILGTPNKITQQLVAELI